MGIYSQIGTDSANDVLESSNKGLNYLAGRKGDDTYIIKNLGNTVTYIDDSVISARTYDDDYKFWNKYLSDNQNFTPIEDGENNGNDTLQINNIKANDLLLFFDVYNQNAQNVNSNDDIEIKDGLFIFKKSTINSVKAQLSKAFSGKIPSNGLVRINAYFSDSVSNNFNNNGISSATEDDSSISYAENRIENIKTTQNGVEKVIDIEKYFQETQKKVRAVLDKYGYSLASEMLMKANTKRRNELLNCYKTPMDLVITDSKNNDKIYAEAGSDTIKLNGGNDIIYNTNSYDKLDFQDKEVGYLMKHGNNLCVNYDDGNVVLSNYYKSKASDRLNSYTDSKGEHSIKDQTIYVEGKEKIYGTEYNDEAWGSEKSDKIYGGGGNDKLYGDWGNDIIYSQSQKGHTVLLAGEEGNDKLYGGAGEDIFYFGEAVEKGEGKDIIYNANSEDKLQFVDINFEDLKFTKSGNNLVITAHDTSNLESDFSKIAYKNFQATISNYFKNDNKLDKIEFITNFNSDKETVFTTESVKNAKIYVSGRGKINGTDFNEVITGSKKADKITTGIGTDVVYAGKGNDTITLGAGDKTLNFSNSDGKDTVCVGTDTNSVKLNFADIKDKGSLSYTKSNNNLVITHLYPNKKGFLVSGGTVTVKDYFDRNKNITSDFSVSINGTDFVNLTDLLEKSHLNITGVYYKKEKATLFAGTDYNDVLTYKAGTAFMCGGKGDDTYNVDMNKKTNVLISDILNGMNAGGENDTLNINTSKDNLALLFNVDKNDIVYTNDFNWNIASDNEGIDSLYIFHKNSLTSKNLLNYFKGKTVNGVIEIGHFFDEVGNKSESGAVFEKDKYGYIENINVKNSDGSYSGIDMEHWIQQIAGEVAGWLNDHSEYSSSVDVLNNGNTTDINSLIKVYQTGSYQDIKTNLTFA